MTETVKMTAPASEGKDANDARNDPHFLNKLDKQIQAVTNPVNWTEAFTVSSKEAEAIVNPEWIIENLVIRGHLIVIPAEPNGGKTTIFFQLCRDMVEKGFKVFYVNADVSGGDAKDMVFEAKEAGFTLMLPDMKVGLSMNDVVLNLMKMNLSGGDFSNYVFIFDTLKKMTDVINKTRSKELYKTLRGLSSKGMTIVLLAHTNKYTDENGKPIFEGTADLRSDVDELIYMIPQKHDDGSLTVSTDPDKVRGKFKPLTFHISPDREVTLAESFIDTARQNKRQKQKDTDLSVIDAIDRAIEANVTTQTGIVAYCKEHFGIGKRTAQGVLKRWSQGEDRIWEATPGFQNNRIDYAKVLPCAK